MAAEPVKIRKPIRLGEDCEFDPESYTLRCGGRAAKLERIPMEIMLFLVEQKGRLVSREEIAERIWGKGVFLDADNSINGAIRKIRRVLRDDPDKPRFIETITGKGYRFIAPVVEPEAGIEADGAAAVSSDSPQSVPVADSREGLDDSRPSRWRLGLMAGGVVLVLAAGIYWIALRGRVSSSTAGGRTMLAVLPFENFTGDAGQDYFSDGLTEEMISQLGNLDPAHLGVIARTSVMRYKQSPEPIPQIGKDLGVQYVIEGSVRRDSERVRITAQLIQVKDQSHLWAREYDRDLGHLLELQGEIAREVANEIEFSLSGKRPIEAAGATAPGAKSYEAYDLYLKGRYFWNKRSADALRQAAEYFQQAIDKDPKYGRAYAGLADSFGLMSTWHVGPQNELMPKARAAAMRALEMDGSLAEAHASLALIKENYDYDWAGAEKEFRLAIQLNPQYATAHQWYAEFLAWQGRFDEAFAESEQARQLDPLSLIIAADHASILYYSRQYDRAVKQSESVLELDPNFSHAWSGVISSYFQMGRYAEAIDVINRTTKEEGSYIWAWRAAAYARWGHTEEARRELAKVEQIPVSRADRTPALLLGYLGTGEKEKALDLMERAYAEHSSAVVGIKVDPMFDSVRSEPRFQELMRRMRLGP